MDETYLTKAIILDRQDWREYDSKLTLYSPAKGKIILVARGVKKLKSKLAGHLEPISLSQIMAIRGRQVDYIGSAVNIECFVGIKSDLDKINAAGDAIRIFNNIIKEGEADESIFNLLTEFLKILDKAGKNYQLLKYFFILKLMSQLGYKPELYNCLKCKKRVSPANNYFDLSKGGLICQECNNNDNKKEILAISSDGIKVLRLAVQSYLNKMTKLKIYNKLKNEVKNIISSFQEYQIY